MAKKQKSEDNDGLQWSFNIVKPDAISRGLAGRIIQRFEDKGLRLVGMKLVWPSRELIEENYKSNGPDGDNEPWFSQLVDYMTSGPVIAMVWEGIKANEVARQIIGKKDPLDSPPGSMRGDFNIEMVRTVVHGSRNAKEAEDEIPLWFFGKGPKPIWDCILGTEAMNPDEGGEGAVTSVPGTPNSKPPVMPGKAIHPIDPGEESGN